ACEARPDVHDRIIREGHVDALAVDVALAALLPGDHPVGVLDQRGGHAMAPRSTSIATAAASGAAIGTQQACRRAPVAAGFATWVDCATAGSPRPATRQHRRSSLDRAARSGFSRLRTTARRREARWALDGTLPIGPSYNIEECR